MIRQRVAASFGRRRSGSENPPTSGSSPREKSQVHTSSSSDDEGDEAKGTFAREGKPWMRVDKSVYEEQLEKLQEQLVQVMLENQNLQGTFSKKTATCS